MTSTELAATVLGQSWALIGFSELMHSTLPEMHLAALKTPAMQTHGVSLTQMVVRVVDGVT